jgi:hypothetical protein
VNSTNIYQAFNGETMMNIRIENLPPGVSVDEIREFLGASDDIEEILLSDAGNKDDVIAMVKVTAGRAGATGMAEFIDGKFFRERRLSAQVMALLNE